jgi:NCS1 family nucleobase:cation symporter-1
MRMDKLSVEEMAQACLARIRERDPTVRGWVHLDPDLVLRNARELDKREVKGPLHGVPIAVKDVIMTADMPTQHNSPLYKASFPTVDAGCIKTLRAAGALIFGKTDTTEFAAVTRGGTARHPFDASRTPGGSSSGSAAVVADMQAPIGLGTQTAGSTIRPGSFCGISICSPMSSPLRTGFPLRPSTCAAPASPPAVRRPGGIRNRRRETHSSAGSASSRKPAPRSRRWIFRRRSHRSPITRRR